MEKKFLAWGLLFGGMSVIIGAFGAHALEEILTSEQLQSFETGIRYQMYHALLLILLAKFPQFSSKLILNALVIGIFLFSFSIYLLNLRYFLNMDFLSFLGPITPIGGLFLIATWALLFFKAVRLNSNSLK